MPPTCHYRARCTRPKGSQQGEHSPHIPKFIYTCRRSDLQVNCLHSKVNTWDGPSVHNLLRSQKTNISWPHLRWPFMLTLPRRINKLDIAFTFVNFNMLTYKLTYFLLLQQKKKIVAHTYVEPPACVLIVKDKPWHLSLSKRKYQAPPLRSIPHTHTNTHIHSHTHTQIHPR